MTMFETSVVIARPLEDVFAYITDLRNNTKWQKSLVEAYLIEGETMDVGSAYLYTVKFMGMRIETEAVVTAFEQNRAFSAKALSGPIPGEFHLEFEPVDSGTVLTTRCYANLGFFKFVKKLALMFAEELYRCDLKTLKRILEN